MNDRRRGLGRGLGALIDAADAPIDALRAPEMPELSGKVRYVEVPPTQIRPNPRQPRQVFDEEALAELVHSIQEIGLLQPVVVRLTNAAEVAAGAPPYELVAGERRWRAAQEAGLDIIPAIVRETADDQLLRDALLENLHRANLNPLEEAAAYQQLLDDFGCTQEDLAQRIGRSRPQVTNTIRLLRLPLAVQRRVAAGVLSAGHARALLVLSDPEDQDKLASRIVAEGLSVRATEEIVAVGIPENSTRSRTPRRNLTAPGLAELAERLSDKLDTRVRVQAGSQRGKVIIEFATLDDLRRIVDLIERD